MLVSFFHKFEHEKKQYNATLDDRRILTRIALQRQMIHNLNNQIAEDADQNDQNEALCQKKDNLERKKKLINYLR